MYPRLFSLIAAACLAAACSNSTDSPTQPSGPVTVERFGRTDASLTYSSGISAPLRAVVRDATSWRGAWATIWGDVSPAPALPTVDFSRDMVVVAALGQRPTGGFSIVIADARVENGGLRVTVRTVSPGPGCGTTLAITQPVDAARLPRFDGRVSYDDVSIVQDCR